MPRLVFISDTHGLHGQLSVPEGDVLIHAGDFSNHGSLPEVVEFGRFLEELPHEHKVVIAGNHDWSFQRRPREAREVLAGVTYLEDESVELAGLRLFGSPWQPEFGNWAFNLPRGEALRRKWAKIPPDTDVLVTHGPPFEILDEIWRGGAVGCEELRKRVGEVKPTVHAFGHIHEGAGSLRSDGTLFVNAASCDRRYRVAHEPVVVDLEDGVARVLGEG